MHWIEENSKVPPSRENPSEHPLAGARHSGASQVFLSRILELPRAGLTAEEIALQVLTTDAKTQRSGDQRWWK
jgi:hypothetical protein